MQRVLGQAFVTIAAGDRAREHRTDRAVRVADPIFEAHRLLVLDRRCSVGDQAMVQGAFQAMILKLAVVARHSRGHPRLIEDAREIEPARLPVVQPLAHVEQVRTADQLVETPNAQLRHDFAHFFGDEEEIVDDMLGRSGELLAQLRILRRDSDRTGVQMTLAHHDAAFDDERCRREAEFVGPQHRADDHVAAGLHLAVDLHGDPAAQAVQHQCLLRFGESQLPRSPSVLDRRFGRRAGAAIVTCDRHMVRLGLGHAGGDRADADFGNQFHADRRQRIRVLQVVNQLREVFDRVDVVMRRRRDQPDSGNREAESRDVFRNFVAGQLAAFAGLGTLCHLDLQLVGVDEVLGGHTEAGGGDLLDLGAQRIAFLERNVDNDAVDA